MKAPFWFVESGSKYRLLERGEDTGVTYASFEKAKADVSARNNAWRAQQAPRAKRSTKKRNPDRIPGGKADDIAIDFFDPMKLAKGIRHELEHTSDPEIASEIARDHLFEDPDYYEKLDYMERTYPPGTSTPNPRRRRASGKMSVPEYIPRTPRSKATKISAVGIRGQWPIGDLYHARLAAIYIKAPSHKTHKAKVLRALEHYYPDYDWQAFVGKPVARRPARRVANPSKPTWKHDRIPMGAGCWSKVVIEDGMVTFTIMNPDGKVSRVIKGPWIKDRLKAAGGQVGYIVQRCIERGAPYPPKENPLVGWEDTSGLQPSTIFTPMVSVVKPDAKMKFEQVYNKVDLPIALAIRPPKWFGEEAATLDPGLNSPYARELQASFVERLGGEAVVLQMLKEHELDKKLAEKLNCILLVLQTDLRQPPLEKGSRAELAQRRGESSRISPYTPFVVLHRLGDVVINRLEFSEQTARPKRTAPSRSSATKRPKRTVPSPLRASELIREIRSAEPPLWDYTNNIKVFSRGVDTAAGRMGVIGRDYLSDLFAKYLLTGKVAYDPENPPPQSAEEEIFRRTVAKNAPALFAEIVEYLKESVPAVIYI